MGDFWGKIVWKSYQIFAKNAYDFLEKAYILERSEYDWE